jgi:nicotinamide riboside kinase
MGSHGDRSTERGPRVSLAKARAGAVGRIVAVLGAESTGKTTLVQGLHRELVARGRDAVIVPETLRTFCEQQGRTPRADEQAALARLHSQHVGEAASRHALVLADTTALMTAVYSDYLFHDRSLYAEALADQAGCDLTLLTSLDLPWVADEGVRDGPQVREPVDRLLREALRSAGLSHAVVAGRGETRLRHALAVVDHLLDAPVRPRKGGQSGRWRWTCAHCDGDADCERHWLTRGLNDAP